ncbi:MAG: DNA translocase FtsK [Bacillota bacterium]
MMAKRQRRHTGFKDELKSQVKGILLLALAVFCYAGLVQTAQTGEMGAFVHNTLRTLAGQTAIVIPFLIGVLALRVMLPQGIFNIKTRLIGILILLVLFMVWAHLQLMIENINRLSGQDFLRVSFQMGLDKNGGGVMGGAFAVLLFYLFNVVGSQIVLATLAVISVLLIINVPVGQLLGAVRRLAGWLLQLLQGTGRFLKETYQILMTGSEEETGRREKKIEETSDHSPLQPVQEEFLLNRLEEQPMQTDTAPQPEPSYYQKERRLALVEPVENGEPAARCHAVVRASLNQYVAPSLELLARPSRVGDHQQSKGIKERARLLENTLQSFGVKARVIHVQSGPTVTRFEVQPEAGVKVSKIISLSDDLALNLAAPLVRIEAPIPGKAALGIEVPNKIIALVYLREVLEDGCFQESPSPLTAGLGKDITGVPVIADLTKMPHLLIAGATGAGKSVCLNTIIISLLYKARPERVRFVMIDPKVVELSIYNGIPHLLMPVVTESKKASLALRSMVKEMGRRYELFAQDGVRDIGAYNELVGSGGEDGEIMPYIVVIIDELADLMLVAPGEVEDSIARLAQMSRAAGIHLVIATQRPSVDVLTGIIKANITSRVAFTVSSQVDSRTILDMAGAEKLLGRGDMLFYPVGAVKPFRVQGAYISEREVKSITDYIKQQGQVEYENKFNTLEMDDSAMEELDQLFPDAVELVVRTGQASISLLQRRFRIGYTRAARLIDDLERRGVVGQHEGSKPREVIITPEQAVKMYEEFKGRMNS